MIICVLNYVILTSLPSTLSERKSYYSSPTIDDRSMCESAGTSEADGVQLCSPVRELLLSQVLHFGGNLNGQRGPGHLP